MAISISGMDKYTFSDCLYSSFLRRLRHSHEGGNPVFELYLQLLVPRFREGKPCPRMTGFDAGMTEIAMFFLFRFPTILSESRVLKLVF